LTVKTLRLKRGQTISKIWGTRRPEVLLTVSIESSDKRTIQAGSARGGEKFEFEVPQGFTASFITGCFYNGAPFPVLIGIGLAIKNNLTGEVVACLEKDQQAGFVDSHHHFDPVRHLSLKQKFGRLLSLEIQTVRRRHATETYEIIKGIDFIFTVDGERKCAIHSFQDIRMDDHKASYVLDLSNKDEYIVNIKAFSSLFIIYLEISTNFGQELKVGSKSISLAAIRHEFGYESQAPDIKQRVISLPREAHVICISGCYEKYL
jgi:hypothetical protein